jgi:hypothetical protein
MLYTIVVRAFAVAVMTVCATAVVLARLVPRVEMSPAQRASHRSVVSAHFFWPRDLPPLVVDTESGIVSPLPLPPRESLERVSFSEWTDDRGEWHVVGHWVEYQVTRSRRELSRTGLARFAFPSGRPVDRILDCPFPECAPCWYPGPEPRVLYASTEGQLVQCRFAGERSRDSAAPGVVRPLCWKTLPASLREPFFTHVVWPKGLGGYLVGALRSAGTRARRGPQRLWWLRLSADGMSITEAGPLLSGEHDRAPSVEHCVPNVAALADGGHLIAYHQRPNGETDDDLIVALLHIDSKTGVPAIDAAKAVTVAHHVMGAPAEFAADGNGIYAVQKLPGGDAEIRRFPITLGDR